MGIVHSFTRIDAQVIEAEFLPAMMEAMRIHDMAPLEPFLDLEEIQRRFKRKPGFERTESGWWLWKREVRRPFPTLTDLLNYALPLSDSLTVDKTFTFVPFERTGLGDEERVWLERVLELAHHTPELPKALGGTVVGAEEVPRLARAIATVERSDALGARRSEAQVDPETATYCRTHLKALSAYLENTPRDRSIHVQAG